MDVPKQQRRRVAVSFDLQSDSSDQEEVDSIFNKYSSTPPSRQMIKGVQRRKVQRVASLAPRSPSRSITPEGETQPEGRDGRLRSPSFKWQHRETSIQRDSDRVLKRVTSDAALNTSTGAPQSEESSSSSDNDSNSSSTTPAHRNQTMKVPRKRCPCYSSCFALTFCSW